ncbi:hypothetical protein CLOSTMETH_02474 [[Clostridium] methylpentosum DSM 5476]|uniref:Uncharacterized protein n=1 Tax=[Clostridium] methylpentosum DSM 5476 TaxID=537013 RepID=C0EF36_9FIRM|nr:hypothetical protein CLOSTMETH_02474 [[Clostridium] methylpentosum DSM 5476]
MDQIHHSSAVPPSCCYCKQISMGYAEISFLQQKGWNYYL